MKKLILMSCLLISTTLTGCASIMSGTSQPVSVATLPTQGAKCTLSNDKGTWNVQTPGHANVHRSYSPLQVNCEKRGHGKGSRSVASTTKGMAFGNIVFGGIIGASIDAANGAAYDYPDSIIIPLT